MTFDEAERKFRDLQARVQRGEPISRADYEAMVAELAVQDDRGVAQQGEAEEQVKGDDGLGHVQLELARFASPWFVPGDRTNWALD